MSQEQRDRVMGRLRAGTAELLVATDVAARGLDVDHAHPRRQLRRARRPPRPTCTASAASAAPAARASPSPSPSPASSACSRTSSGSPGRRSRSRRCRRVADLRARRTGADQRHAARGRCSPDDLDATGSSSTPWPTSSTDRGGARRGEAGPRGDGPGPTRRRSPTSPPASPRTATAIATSGRHGTVTAARGRRARGRPRRA